MHYPDMWEQNSHLFIKNEMLLLSNFTSHFLHFSKIFYRFFCWVYKTEHSMQRNQVTSSMYLQRASLFLSHPPLLSSSSRALLHDNYFHNPPSWAIPGQGPESCLGAKESFFLSSSFPFLRQHISITLKNSVSRTYRSSLFIRNPWQGRLHMT